MYSCDCVVRRVENAIKKVAADVDAAPSQAGKKQKGVSKVKQKARACLQEMVANVSPAFIRQFYFKYFSLFLLWKIMYF